MIAMIRKFLDLAGERKKQLYLAWLFQALTSICEGAIYFMLFLAIKDILGGSFTREKLIQYSLMFLVYTVLHFIFYYFTIVKQRPVSYAMMRDERLSIAAKIKQFPLYYFTKDKISQLTSLFTIDLSFVEMKTAETPAGTFTINRSEIPANYICAAEQKIEKISENHIRIITMDQKVLFENQILSPRICQSCMNPEKITIYPLEIECIGEKVRFKDHYSAKEWKKSEPLPEIREWYPHIKKAGCIPCRNCGRC